MGFLQMFSHMGRNTHKPYSFNLKNDPYLHRHILVMFYEITKFKRNKFLAVYWQKVQF